MNGLTRGRFFKTVFAAKLNAQTKSLLAVLSLHNVRYVCLHPSRKPEIKNTLIAAFFNN